VKPILILLIVALVLALGFFVYRARQDSQLNVTPDARRAIEKAKQR
jgi:Tfp pilus assembly protein PilO